MVIKGTCGHCGREVQAEQLTQSGGHCPWCGKPFTRDYTANLVISLREADAAGDVLEAALEKIAGMEPALELDPESILGPLRASLESLHRRRVRG